MDRSEQAGLGVAVIGHIALFALLSLSLLHKTDLPKIENDPVEVELVDEAALQSTAPETAPAVAPAPAPIVAQPAPPDPVPSLPLPKPVEKPKPKPVKKAELKPEPKPVSKPSPPKATKPVAETKPLHKPSLSRSILGGLSDTPSNSISTKPVKTAQVGAPAKVIGPAVLSSIGAEIRRQLKPHWKSPTGADVELIKTTLIVHLDKDGSIIGTPTLDSQSGVNESNRTQAKLHVDQAIKAVRLAAPFKLPVEFYDAWKVIRPSFDKRLSQ